MKWVGPLNPLLHRPTTAPVATQEQVDKFLSLVEARFGFVRNAVASSTVTLTGSEDTSGLRVPRATGERATDGRAALLNSLVFRTVLDNADQLHAYKARLAVDIMKRRLTAAVVEAFTAAVVLDGRWSLESATREAASNVSRTADRVLAGELVPMRRATVEQPRARADPRPVVRASTVTRPSRPLVRYPAPSEPTARRPVIRWPGQ